MKTSFPSERQPIQFSTGPTKIQFLPSPLAQTQVAQTILTFSLKSISSSEDRSRATLLLRQRNIIYSAAVLYSDHVAAATAAATATATATQHLWEGKENNNVLQSPSFPCTLTPALIFLFTSLHLLPSPVTAEVINGTFLSFRRKTMQDEVLTATADGAPRPLAAQTGHIILRVIKAKA